MLVTYVDAVGVLFWAAGLLLLYTYVGYPLVVVARARLRPRPVNARPATPFVSVVVVAHDEERRIAARLDNLLSLDYPPERLEILVGSDGSTDDTVPRAKERESSRLRVFPFAKRRGKPAVLNDVVPQARGDVVLFADARQRFEAGALRTLASAFSDDAVGAASGELVLTSDEHPSNAVGEGVGFYWRYEKMMRVGESAIDSTVGATGAIYAVRRTLFEPIPEDTILDDVVIPLRVVRRGYRVVFVRGAVAYDHVTTNARNELRRKARTIGGTFQLFAHERWLLDPRRNRIWFQTVSHKLLRLLSPILLALVAVASLLLSESEFYRTALLLQFAFYTLALAGHLFANGERRSPVLGVPYAFCLLNWATVVGLFRFLSGRQSATWERAD
jgi:cellulose synthase/poly-beta-1,6-N-acetylglucosamine synthase-like glycosyltransferase